MAMIAVLFGGITGTAAFLVAVVFLDFSLSSAAQLYFATGVATMTLVCLWRAIISLKDKFAGHTVMNLQDQAKGRR